MSNFRKESANIVRTVFNKSNLNFLRNLFNRNGKIRDYWTLARRMSENDTFTHHTEREEFLLHKGAFENDVYSMCELARYLFISNDNRLPQALSWWHKAVKQHDDGATYDIQNLPNKNESYDTIGIATFVLFFLSKLPVTQGFGAMWQKRIVSLSYPPALISMLFRGVLTPCSDAEIHNETFLKRIISL